MKNKLLLPASFRLPALIVCLLSFWLFSVNLTGFQFHFLDTATKVEGSFENIFEDHNLTNELAYLGLIAGLIGIAFARVPGEDERITLIRLQSLQVSHYFSYLVFAVGLLLINGMSFLIALLCVPYLFLIIFIIVFYCRLYLLPKFANNEK